MTTSTTTISRMASDAITAVFRRSKALIGVLHLDLLPGAPRYEGSGVQAIYDRGLSDARAYLEGGCDGVIFKNHGDVPFAKPDDIGPEVAAPMAVIADHIRTSLGKPVGVIMLANAPIPGARRRLCQRCRTSRLSSPARPRWTAFGIRLICIAACVQKPRPTPATRA